MKRPRLKLCVFPAICLTWLLACCPLAIAQEAENNQWTYFKDNKSFSAAFVRLDGDKAIFRSLTTAQEAAIPLKLLSMESHLRVLKLSKPEAFSKPLTKAPPKIDKVELAKPVASQPVGDLVRSPFKPNSSIEDFLQTAKVELGKGNTMVAWHALPPKIQKSIDSLIVKSMQKVGDRTLGQIRSVMGSIDTIFQEKGQFIFDHPQVQQTGEADELKKMWPIFAGIVHAIAAEEKWEMSAFQEGKTAEWMASITGDLSGFLPLIETAIKESDAPLPPDFDMKNLVDYKILSQSKGRAEVELIFNFPDAPPNMTVKFQQYKGIWLVPSLMNGLEDAVEEAHAAVDAGAIDPQQITRGLGFINGIIGPLSKASTQEEFNEVIENIMAMIPQNVAGPMFGGPGGPGGVGAGGPSGFGPPPSF